MLASGKIVIGEREYLASEKNGELVTDDKNYDEEGMLKKNCWENVNGDEYYIDAFKLFTLSDFHSRYSCCDCNVPKLERDAGRTAGTRAGIKSDQ